MKRYVNCNHCHGTGKILVSETELSAEQALEILKIPRIGKGARQLYECQDGSYGIDYAGGSVSSNTVRYMLSKKMIDPYWSDKPELKAYKINPMTHHNRSGEGSND